ncbi:MAG: ubiquinol-cytochrome c reductase iron-sulfur subunit [Nitrococcus sp.]|nr:ubiquinol-cytochrome c reductase iron-sulfur subunit [Nitrococcus sp.]
MSFEVGQSGRSSAKEIPAEAADPRRRRFLTATASVVGAVGAGFVVTPFIEALWPSVRTQARGSPIEVDVGKLGKGQMITVVWRSRPIWVLHRTDSQLQTLARMDSRLKDPKSQAAQEPPQLQSSGKWNNKARSIKPRYLVLVAICTHLGCIPEYRPEVADVRIGPDWLGGFFCPCHGSRYDLAGRVFQGSPAPLNLPVPPYYFKSDTLVRIGELANGLGQNWTPAVW